MSPTACNLLLNAQSVDGDSALSIAAAKGHADVVSALLLVPTGIAVDLNVQGRPSSLILYQYYVNYVFPYLDLLTE